MQHYTSILSCRFLVVLFLFTCCFYSGSAAAIYQIIKCRNTYTTIDGGQNWAKGEECYVSGYGGSGFWNIGGDREEPVREYHPTAYVVKTDAGSREIQKQEAITLCKDLAVTEYEQCTRGAVLGGGAASYVCGKLRHPLASFACMVATGGLANEGILYCDSEKTDAHKECDKIAD